MLQNRHYEHMDFDAKLSARFFDTYIEAIDVGRLYFTQADIDGLKKKYRDQLHIRLLKKESMPVAKEVYEIYRTRVKERIAFANKLIDEANFDFKSDKFVHRSRKELGWPKDKTESDVLWANLVEDAFLSETLRREGIEQLAKEQGKVDVLKKEKPIKDKIKLRYKRILEGVLNTDDEEVANYFLSAIAKAYDPHTDYFSAREYDRFRSNIGTGLVGIGAMLQAEEDGATVIKGIVVNGPADKQGELKLNDRVIGVDKDGSGEVVDIMFMKIDKVVELIRGKEGVDVRLKVEPASGGETKFVTIKRGKVEMKDEQAKAQIIDKKMADGTSKRMGIISLPSFYADFGSQNGAYCSVHVEKLLTRLNKENIEGLIFDLRGNGGGSLEEVRRMTGFFIGSGPVVQVKDHRNRIRVQSSSNDKPVYTGPMVVLIDKTSASASEILAGALQDYNRAIVVGDTSTFGKGTVQQPFDIRQMMPFNADRARAGHLKPTIQKFYRAAGSSTQLKGVESDIVLPSIYEGLEIGEKFLPFALKHDEIPAAEGMKKFKKDALFLTELKKRSNKRINASNDFKYVMEDIARTKKLVKENKVSLNKDNRQAEIAKVDERTKTRNKERRERFAKMQAEDMKNLTLYSLTLDDLKNKDSLRKVDLTKEGEDYMRRAKEDLEDLDQTPEWPSRIDSVKREGISILLDLIELSKSKELAKVK